MAETQRIGIANRFLVGHHSQLRRSWGIRNSKLEYRLLRLLQRKGCKYLKNHSLSRSSKPYTVPTPCHPSVSRRNREPQPPHSMENQSHQPRHVPRKPALVIFPQSISLKTMIADNLDLRSRYTTLLDITFRLQRGETSSSLIILKEKKLTLVFSLSWIRFSWSHSVQAQTNGGRYPQTVKSLKRMSLFFFSRARHMLRSRHYYNLYL